MQTHVIKLAKYLKETVNKEIFYFKTKFSKQLKFELIGYADVAYVDCLVTRKSTAKYLFCLNRLLLTWQNKKQLLVVTSTTKTEYMTTYEAIKEVVWLKKLLEDMGCEQNGLIILFKDNNKAKSQTENLLHHKKTKYIDIIYNYAKQMVSKNIVKLEKINTID